MDCVANEPKRLDEIASPELLANLQQLVCVVSYIVVRNKYLLNGSLHEIFTLNVLCFQLVVTPPLVSTGTFILVLRMLAQLCARSPSIAVKLLEQNIVGTLSSLLLGSSNSGADVVSDEVGLVVSSVDALFMITLLLVVYK